MDELKKSLTKVQIRAARRALLRAIAISGSQARLAASIRITQQALSKWLQKDGLVPGRFVVGIENTTGVSRHDLRPDIYPAEPSRRFHGVDQGVERVSFQNGGISQRNTETGEAA